MRRKKDGLPPCIYKKHGAYYLVKDNRWQPLGKDLPAALAAYGKRITGSPGSMAELIDKALAQVKQSKTTRGQYRNLAEKLKDVFEEFEPHEVKPKHVAAMKVKYAHKPFYANRLMSLLRVIFNYAVEWQLVESNPCVGVKRHVEAKRKRYLTDLEYAAIYSHAGERLKVIIELCYLTAQRISDVLRIKRQDVSERGIAFEQGKTGAKLAVVWNDDLKVAVASAKALSEVIGMTYLLPSKKRHKAPDYRSVALQWSLACKAAGVENARLHDLRAKSLTDAQREGKDATALAGHTNKAMTDRYIRLRETPEVKGPNLRRTQ